MLKEVLSKESGGRPWGRFLWRVEHNRIRLDLSKADMAARLMALLPEEENLPALEPLRSEDPELRETAEALRR